MEYEEGCLSVPDLHWTIVRPKEVHLVGRDLEGNEVSIEADELLARVFQHELDHLNGILLLEHLDKDQRKQAMRCCAPGHCLTSPGAASALEPNCRERLRDKARLFWHTRDCRRGASRPARAGHEVALVVTAPDRRRGRGSALSYPHR